VGKTIAILIVRAKSNRLADLLSLVPELLRRLKTARRGVIHHIGGGAPAS
jgi:hypothetical protein